MTATAYFRNTRVLRNLYGKRKLNHTYHFNFYSDRDLSQRDRRVRLTFQGNSAS
jgi:hypothetical protein